MPLTATVVLDAVRAVAPAVGLSMGNRNDPSTWRIDFDETATDEQREAAAGVLISFDRVRAIKAEFIRKVNDDAERVRQRYVTPGAGQAITYQEKYKQAEAVDDLGQAAANALTPQQAAQQFPTLAASIGIEAETLWACAQLVVSRYEQFAELSGVIERIRLTGIKSISDASDAAAAQAAYEAITWTQLP